ncbi:transcriptional regulator SlyA [Sideroxyarcus emersonii]|uniref:Transcriptional regulator SlyA n=1 Tax=Sideroxyarcus emersonii TaxID=2764705 RepID=A0AAN1X8C5_9PROT|nr:MarR family transcriptional regulator [Sideroxyarcus emersonii]BCK86795.1 transcriptional regulator SlyA [Sideroxyarcus emersonii]
MFSENLWFVLRNTSQLLARNIRQDISGMALTFLQIRVLIGISYREGIRQVDLADGMDVQPITLVHAIDQLAKIGLVERRKDPDDRRAYQLFLTPAASPYLSAIEEVVAAIQTDMLRGLSKEQVSLLSSALQIMRDNLASRLLEQAK